MKKKLQVFISSTYIDMIEERQAAVTAVLNAGHIPAGMELFKSGDQSQKETIKRWINESDVYMLILGSRYGSIDSESGKSYTHWEYDYAGQQGKRRFAIVIKDEMEKAKTNPEYLEREHFTEYQDFKKEVLSNISKFYEDIKDIKLTVMESLKEYEADESLAGWVRSDNVQSIEKLLLENAQLQKENAKLTRDFENVNSKLTQGTYINGMQFDELRDVLENITIKLSKKIDKDESEVSLLRFFIVQSDRLSVGVTNSVQSKDLDIFTYYNVAPKLMQFGLMEKVKVAGVKYEKIQTTKEGFRFLAQYEVSEMQQTATQR
ncbi:DUF4062 domain-containing protein [Paenibacillus peoriae]|uniref:DUF4062 domain-containing protein n=1 Tax=Paenibacillus peoriae TaxID=59893 RepID=A0A7H0Y329_9BACL|nr:DUF4062 domain-containing protein [Paenibacillus peoriae]QNR65487.1 DUF4062 domain-containing protein [Paenibacillus peoriae]